MSLSFGNCLSALLLTLLSCGGCGRVGVVGFSYSHSHGQTTILLDSQTPREGSGELVVATREIGAFTGVSARHGLKVVVDDPSSGRQTGLVTVEADDNLQELIETTVLDGVLQVRLAGSLTTNNPIAVRVAGGELPDLHAANSGRITATQATANEVTITSESSGAIVVGSVQAARVRLIARGAGSIEANGMAAQQVRADVESSGRIEVSGSTDELQIEASSAGRISASELASRIVRAHCTSAARAELHAVEAFSGTAESAGNILVQGQPPRYDAQVRSAGRIEKRE